nr:unnamed protein product [Digitaria exilis]
MYSSSSRAVAPEILSAMAFRGSDTTSPALATADARKMAFPRRVSSVAPTPRAVHAHRHTWATTAVNVDSFFFLPPPTLSASILALDNGRMADSKGTFAAVRPPRRWREYSAWSKRTTGGVRARRSVRSSHGRGGEGSPPAAPPLAMAAHVFTKSSAARPSAAVWWIAAPTYTPPHLNKVTWNMARMMPARSSAEGTSFRRSSPDGTRPARSSGRGASERAVTKSAPSPVQWISRRPSPSRASRPARGAALRTSGAKKAGSGSELGRQT